MRSGRASGGPTGRAPHAAQPPDRSLSDFTPQQGQTFNFASPHEKEEKVVSYQ
jgi:hypothetical protein